MAYNFYKLYVWRKVIRSKSKSDISSYIKKRLRILRADDEYEQVKARVF